MKKLKLNKFKIASLSNLKKITGGSDEGTNGIDTERHVCINGSADWILVGKDGPVIGDPNQEIENL